METIRFSTWNLGHAVHSKQPFAQQWEWFEGNVGADLVVLTEVKPDFSLCGPDWSFVHKEDGIGPRRRWGTAIGAFGVSLRDVTAGVPGKDGFSVEHTWPGYVTIADVEDEESDEPLLTIVGIHAPIVDLQGTKIGSGHVSVPVILRDLQGLFDSPRGENLIIAGDFNLLPRDMPESIYERFIDVVEESAEARDTLPGCRGCSMGDDCGHLWTHRNGNGPNAAVQNIDYVFISEGLADFVRAVGGGGAEFPDAWDVSDHAPVIFDMAAAEDDED